MNCSCYRDQAFILYIVYLIVNIILWHETNVVEYGKKRILTLGNVVLLQMTFCAGILVNELVNMIVKHTLAQPRLCAGHVFYGLLCCVSCPVYIRQVRLEVNYAE